MTTSHSWAWQLGFAFHHRAQVCLRAGCDWRRKRVEIRNRKKRMTSRWAYARGAGRLYRLLLRLPPCPGASIQPAKQQAGNTPLRAAVPGASEHSQHPPART